MRRIIATFIFVLAAARAFAQTPAPPAFRPTLTISGYFQGEFDAGAVGDSRFPASDRFFVRRARLTASGNVTPTFAYRLQAEFAGGLSAATGVTASLTDGYVEWTQIPEAHIRFGQFKAPYGRESFAPSTQLVTIERSLVSDRLSLNRQIGVEALGDLAGGRVAYLAAVFNGNGRNTTVNDNRDFMYVARGTVTPWRLRNAGRLDIGANAYSSHDAGSSAGRHSGAGLDEHFERGFWSLDAEWLRARFEPDASGAPVVTSGGWYVTPAAYVCGRLLQVAGRYERYRPDVHVDGNDTSTWVGGLNYYARGDSAKLMVDYLWVTTPAATDHAKLLARIQVMF